MLDAGAPIRFPPAATGSILAAPAVVVTVVTIVHPPSPLLPPTVPDPTLSVATTSPVPHLSGIHAAEHLSGNTVTHPPPPVPLTAPSDPGLGLSQAVSSYPSVHPGKHTPRQGQKRQSVIVIVIYSHYVALAISRNLYLILTYSTTFGLSEPVILITYMLYTYISRP